MGAVTAPDSEMSDSEDAGGSAEAWHVRTGSGVRAAMGTHRQRGSPGEASRGRWQLN